jgi:hypothetical protein
LNLNSKQKPLIVICPGGNVTGGVELLHQLVDSASAFGHPAYICYYPFNRTFRIPEPYKKYDCPVVQYSEIQDVVADIVLPEVYHYLNAKFPKSRIYLWWLSVDNYLGSLKYSYAWSNRFMPWTAWNIKKKPKSLSGHLYQSEYAKIFIDKFGIKNSIELSDYINQDYLLHAQSVSHAEKKDIVAFNPAKGYEQISRIMQAASSMHFVPIKNMSREQVVQLLHDAKVYIDFGNHPGKDRIPREAAIMGCCVITNKRGSAENNVDIDIPEDYKFDDSKIGYEKEVVSLVDGIFRDFTNHQHHFGTYRKIIKNEKDYFNQSVKRFLEVL